MTTLYICEGSEFRQADNYVILSEACRVISRKLRTGISAVRHPHRVAELLRIQMAGRDYEVFGLLHLDARHRLIEVEELFRGTIDGAHVYPREVVKSVIQHQSAAVILYHNHPSGVAEPSERDEQVTQALKAALATIDVRVLDHLILGDQFFSFAEHGML